MFKKHFAFLLMLFGLAVLTSCSYLQKQFLQVRLSRTKDSKAQRVTYNPPPFPYKPEKSQKLDKLWRSVKDHSSISYFSSCTKIKQDLSLEEIQQNILSEVPQWKLLNTNSSSHFLHSRFQVIGENYETINSIYIFKNHSCFFVLNFVAGSPAVFKQNEPLFRNFIKGFKVL